MRVEHAWPLTAAVEGADEEEGEEPRAEVAAVDPHRHQTDGERLRGSRAEVESLAADLVGDKAPPHAAREVAQVQHGRLQMHAQRRHGAGSNQQVDSSKPGACVPPLCST